jgi:hypothetical protein
MTFSVILVATSIAVSQDPSVLVQPQPVAEPVRLALTPNIDGMIKADEWDFFAQSNEGETFFQWEPGKLYFAGRFKADRELVVSVDTRQDGWLVGKDNVEFRIRVNGNSATVYARQLDATRATGPRWVDLPKLSLASLARASENNGEAVVEAMVQDPGVDILPIRDKERFNLRMDVIAQSSQSLDPFLPRIGTLVRLATQRASAMPVGLDWKVEDPGRSITQGRSASVRFSFSSKANPGLKKVEVKPLGMLARHAQTLTRPFPELKKGRAFFDYETKAGSEAPTGFHLVATTLFTSDGIPSMIQASVRVAPLVDFSIVEDRFKLRTGVQELKIPFYIESNSTLRLDGSYSVELPARWSTVLGQERNFLIYNSRASVRRVLTIKMPADSAGTFPLHFKAVIGDRVVEQTRWVTVVRN